MEQLTQIFQRLEPWKTRALQRLEPWKARILPHLDPWKTKILQHLDPWKTRLLPHLEQGKVWAVQGLDYISPDWNQVLRERNNRLMLEKLYRDLGGSDFVIQRKRNGEPAGIGIISPVDTDLIILNELTLTLSPLEWKQEGDSLDMSGLANLPENFGPSNPISSKIG